MIKLCTNELFPGNKTLPKLIKSRNIGYIFINKSVRKKRVMNLNSYKFDKFIYQICVLHGIQVEPFEL